MITLAVHSDKELIGLLSTRLQQARAEEIDELHLVVFGAGATIGSYIGYLTPDLLARFAKLNAALERSPYDVVSVLNYETTCIWWPDIGWSSVGEATTPD